MYHTAQKPCEFKFFESKIFFSALLCFKMPNSTTQNLNKTLNFLENSMAAQKVHGFEEIFALILLGQFQF